MFNTCQFLESQNDVLLMIIFLQVFANPEDALSKRSKVKYDDADVERVRR